MSVTNTQPVSCKMRPSCHLTSYRSHLAYLGCNAFYTLHVVSHLPDDHKTGSEQCSCELKLILANSQHHTHELPICGVICFLNDVALFSFCVLKWSALGAAMFASSMVTPVDDRCGGFIRTDSVGHNLCSKGRVDDCNVARA